MCQDYVNLTSILGTASHVELSEIKERERPKFKKIRAQIWGFLTRVKLAGYSKMQRFRDSKDSQRGEYLNLL